MDFRSIFKKRSKEPNKFYTALDAEPGFMEKESFQAESYVSTDSSLNSEFSTISYKYQTNLQQRISELEQGNLRLGDENKYLREKVVNLKESIRLHEMLKRTETLVGTNLTIPAFLPPPPPPPPPPLPFAPLSLWSSGAKGLQSALADKGKKLKNAKESGGDQTNNKANQTEFDKLMNTKNAIVESINKGGFKLKPVTRNTKSSEPVKEGLTEFQKALQRIKKDVPILKSENQQDPKDDD